MGLHLAPEHAPRPVVDPHLEALNQVSKIWDPQVIQRQQSGRRWRGRQSKNSTQRDYSLFEIVEYAAHIRDQYSQKNASKTDTKINAWLGYLTACSRGVPMYKSGDVNV